MKVTYSHGAGIDRNDKVVSQGHSIVSYSKVKKILFNGQEYLAFSIEVLRNTVCFVLIMFNFPGFNGPYSSIFI